MRRNEKEGERGVSEKNSSTYEESPLWEKSISSYKYLGYICNKIQCYVLGLDEKEARELDHWTRKQLIAGRALYPKSNVIRIYIKCRCGDEV